jgi:hypothetical protein
MKAFRIMTRALVLIALLGASVAVAQAAFSSAATRSITYDVSQVGDSGVLGTVFIGEYGPNTTAVVISLDGTSAGGTHPAHFHSGDCGSGGGIIVPLTSVDGSTGMSITLTDEPYDDILESDLYLNIHRSPNDISTIVACGEVGTGVRPLLQQTRSDAGDADQSEAEPVTQPTETVRVGAPETASYGLFPVAGSSIRGHVQFTEQVEGGTKVVVSLTGITEGNLYGVALYQGDCGPDRPKVRDLNPVGERPQDPYVSITDSDLNFLTVTEGDHFMYVFSSADGSDVVACGEVGAGANR